jgi:Saccharopine dehydrogenase NADP binding domain
VNQFITVFGAYGHTGRFVVAELSRRGIPTIVSGRDGDKLAAVAKAHPESEIRVATIGDPTSLDHALADAGAVINCAGPFGETAPALIEAALRAGIHYLDVTGEALVTFNTFKHYADNEPDAARVREAGIVIAPSVAFYGALGDFLATVAMKNWQSVNEIAIAVALDSWKPTRGTRLASERRAGRRVVYRHGQIEILSAETQPPMSTWNFPPPFGVQEVVGEFTTVDVVTISRHLNAPKISAYLNKAPIEDLRNPNTTGPQPADASGRSSQIFVVEVVARRGGAEHYAVARGRDIYAITAPIVVEAAQRILDGRLKRTGIGSPGEIFDAESFLRSLAPDQLSFETNETNTT